MKNIKIFAKKLLRLIWQTRYNYLVKKNEEENDGKKYYKELQCKEMRPMPGWALLE